MISIQQCVRVRRLISGQAHRDEGVTHAISLTQRCQMRFQTLSIQKRCNNANLILMNLFRPQNHNNGIIDDWLCYWKYQHQFILLITRNDLCIYDQHQQQHQQQHQTYQPLSFHRSTAEWAQTSGINMIVHYVGIVRPCSMLIRTSIDIVVECCCFPKFNVH